MEKQISVEAVAREVGLNQHSVERRLAMVGFDSSDLARIQSIRNIVAKNIRLYAQSFFEFLAPLDEARELLANRDSAERARMLKEEHLHAMLQGQYGIPYVEQRLKLGLLYAHHGLDPRAFLGAFHHVLHRIGTDVLTHFEGGPLEGFEAIMSLKKIAFFDIGIILDILIHARERVIRQQQEAIRELSTPVLQVRERMLLLPIIGVIDTQRAKLVTDGLLRAIRSARAKVVVMDVTGVATIDSKVAHHILQTAVAARLMGATVIVTGLSPEVSQSLAALGIDLERFNTVGDLQGGLEEAERLLGFRVVASDELPS